ncbi:MAG: class II aldolase [Alphaproteobacteria bacterium]|nr:class II aldolase [Alphaproteobacteria bacterium]
MATKLHAATSASVKDRVSPEEWAVRLDLAAAYRAAAHYGWDDLIFTHFSARVPGPDEHFLLNPFGMMFREVTASTLIKVDLEGTVVMESEWECNPAAFVIHGVVHESRPDARCVMHLHTVAGVGVSAQPDGLLPIGQTNAALVNDVAYHDYEGLALDMDERVRLVADLGARNRMILRNHGLLTVGGSVGEAFGRMYGLQRACEYQIAAQAGGRLNLLSREICDKAQEQSRTGFRTPLNVLAWAAIRRLADDLYPSYRQ